MQGAVISSVCAAITPVLLCSFAVRSFNIHIVWLHHLPDSIHIFLTKKKRLFDRVGGHVELTRLQFELRVNDKIDIFLEDEPESEMTREKSIKIMNNWSKMVRHIERKGNIYKRIKSD